MKDIKIQTIKYYSILDNIKKFILSIYPYVICIVVHGSVARGDVELFSDIDISAIVLDEDISKVKDRRISKIINNTVVNISILSISEFISIFGTRDIYEVIWKKAVTPESKPLYDPYNIFSHLLSACEVDVDENLEEQILYRTYTSSLIFMGKINNAYIRNDIPYLLDSALMLAHQIAHIILTINKIYINSWKYIYINY